MGAIFGLPVVWGLFIGAFILLAYSTLGGMIAGVWTDFVQATTMIVGSVFVFAFALSFGGGMESISRSLASADPAFVSPFGAMDAPAATIFTALGWWILFSIGTAGQPHLITKFYMSRNLRILRWGAPIAAVTYAISSLIAFSAGLSMRAMVEAGQTAAPKSASVVGPVFVLEHTPGVVAGLILAALLAAIMSTSDSFLNIGAAAISRDIPRALGRPIEGFPMETYDAMHQIMLRAPLYLTKLCLPHVRSTDDGVGCIGNMCSVHGHYVTADKVAYNVSKFGLRGLTQSIAAEGNGTLRSFSISTGYVKTPLVTEQIPKTADQRGISVDEVVEDVMLGQARTTEMMDPIDAANLFVFGFSAHAAHLNGGDLLFDGGMTLTYE